MEYITYNEYRIYSMSGGGIMKFDVEFYRKQNGECPIEDFLDQLDHKIRAKVLRDLELLEARGKELRQAKQYRKDYLGRGESK